MILKLSFNELNFPLQIISLIFNDFSKMKATIETKYYSFNISKSLNKRIVKFILNIHRQICIDSRVRNAALQRISFSSPKLLFK